jgi:hypothetical protein
MRTTTVTVDQGIALVGIIIAVAFGIGGVLAAKAVRRKKVTQSQKVGNGSAAIMSGRDTRVGKN